MERIAVFVDESGNPGRGRGRYFTIACIVVKLEDCKRIRNKMKRLTKIIKDNHPLKNWENNEVKSARIRLEERCELIKNLPKECINVYCITVDTKNVSGRMHEHHNLSYNFWLKLVIDHIVEDNLDCKEINFFIDRRNIKISSGNSFNDYITIHLVYEKGLNIKVKTDYPESHLDYGIQVADFISNVINYYYINPKDIIKDALVQLIQSEEKFPYKKFGD